MKHVILVGLGLYVVVMFLVSVNRTRYVMAGMAKLRGGATLPFAWAYWKGWVGVAWFTLSGMVTIPYELALIARKYVKVRRSQDEMGAVEVLAAPKDPPSEEPPSEGP
jgi:hypothetical protein